MISFFRQSLIALLLVSPFLIACKKNSSTTYQKQIVWEQVSQLPVLSIRSLQFLSKDTGFILGLDKNETKRMLLLKTYDGGASWDSVIFSNSFIQDTAARAYFTTLGVLPTDPSILFVTGSRSFRSTNGGNSWIRLDSTPSMRNPNVISSYAFPSPKSYLTAGDAIYLSKDSGITWSEIYRPGGFLVFDLFQFSSERIGFASAGVVYDGANGGILIKTIDGGESWTEISYPLGKAITGLHFISNEIGFIAIDLYEGGITGTTRSGTSIYKTIDGGNTWLSVNTDVFSGDFRTFGKIFFRNEVEGYAQVSGVGAFYITTDGGKTWNNESPNQSQNYLMSFPKGKTVYLLDNSGNLFRHDL